MESFKAYIAKLVTHFKRLPTLDVEKADTIPVTPSLEVQPEKANNAFKMMKWSIPVFVIIILVFIIILITQIYYWVK